MKVSSVIPALNEASRIQPVLEAVRQASLVDDVLVVSDGSTDDTYERALEVPGIRAIRLERNIGKAGAMRLGALECQSDILIFIDADLQGLKPDHVDAIAAPVVEGEASMSVGIFRGGRFWTDLAQKIAPVISGQRAIRRDLFLSIDGLADRRMGVEIALTRWARLGDIPVATVPIDGVTHVMKEEKLGKVRGFASRMMMYYDIGKVMADTSSLRKNGSRKSQVRHDSKVR